MTKVTDDSGYGSPSKHIDDDSLENIDWFWGNVDRVFCDQLLNGASDGSFLVRYSLNQKRNKEFTLTLRKDMANKLIKIYFEHGKYGFAKPLAFTSLQNLIEFYQSHSLIEYNRSLDIKLGKPVCKSSYRSRSSSKSSNGHESNQFVDNNDNLTGCSPKKSTPISYRSLLQNIAQKHLMKSRIANRIYVQLNLTRSTLEKDRKAAHALSCLIEAFDRQMLLLTRNAQTYVTMLSGRDMSIIENNMSTMQTKRVQLLHHLTALQQKINQHETKCGELETHFNQLKPVLMDLHRRKENLKIQLINRGFNQVTVDNWINEDEETLNATQMEDGTNEMDTNEHQTIGSLAQLNLLDDDIDKDLIHESNQLYEQIEPDQKFNIDSNDWISNDEKLWLITNCDRNRAENLLRGKEIGTFLIRPSGKPNSSHALSITITHGQVRHCLIYKNATTNLYGFAEPLRFVNLHELVEFYRHHSLVEHNAELNTCLITPINYVNNNVASNLTLQSHL